MFKVFGLISGRLSRYPEEPAQAVALHNDISSTDLACFELQCFIQYKGWSYRTTWTKKAAIKI